MEEKKIKISLSTIFLIISILVIGVMGFFIYKLNNDNKNANIKLENLNSQVEQLKNEINSLKVNNKENKVENEIISTSTAKDVKSVDLNNYEFKSDTQNKYIITTDSRWITMQNDGGSNTNIYYQVDLDNNIICKVVESYVANIGGTPEKRKNIDFTKRIDNNIQLEVKDLINEVITKEDINESSNYSFYTIEVLNNIKKIYNVNTIKSIKTLLNRIDEL